MKIENSILINAPVSRCWTVISEQFGDIQFWSAGVAKSFMKEPDAALLGNTRTCEIPGFGTIQELVTKFDPAHHELAYSINGMPFFVKSTENSWRAESRGNGLTYVESVVEMDFSGLLGTLMSPMLRRRFSTGTDRMLEELKTYIETGERHPRTLAALAKQTT